MANVFATTQSQRDLVHSTCLRSHTIPHGLEINVNPCVPKSPSREPTSRLQKDWARITRRAANGFLAALRSYHRSCAHQLRLQATNLEPSMVAQEGKARANRSINIAKEVYAKCDYHLRLTAPSASSMCLSRTGHHTLRSRNKHSPLCAQIAKPRARCPPSTTRRINEFCGPNASY